MRLGQADTGHLMIVSDTAFPDDVKRVEYYRESKLFNIVFNDTDHSGALSELELPDDIDQIVSHAPSTMIVLNVADTDNIQQFDVPLILVGV